MDKRWFVCVILLFVGHAYGQDASIPDTLDWRGYYPLEIGNMWEWKTEILVAYQGLDAREIIGDTLIGGISYFVEAAYGEAFDPLNGVDRSGRDTVFVRYDTSQKRVVVYDRDEQAEYPRTCDLSTAFESIIMCDGWGEMMVDGNYAEAFGTINIGIDAPFRALKEFYNLGGGENFFHGIGRLPGVGDGAQGTIYFTYVRIGGTEYGTPVVTLPVEKPEVLPEEMMTLYPNPVRDVLIVETKRAALLSLGVYDGLGRLVMQQACFEWMCSLDVRQLQAGVHFLRVRGGTEKQHARPFVVIE